MARIVFVLMLFFPLVNNAQYSQSDPWEKIEVPENKDDFTSILNFWKQFNLIQIEELLKLDSILFYKNDTLKYTYYIADLKFFQTNMKLADAAMRASTDSVYNKEKSSFDFYFTDIEKNRYLENRKYLNKNGKYFKAEQFSEGTIAVVTNWQADENNYIVKETNEFIADSSIYTMSYRRNKSVILERYAKVKSKGSNYEYIIEYNKQGGITKYSYFDLDHKFNDRENDVIKIERDKDNLTRKIEGTINDKPIVFNFSYPGNTIRITRQTSFRQTVFKLVTF